MNASPLTRKISRIGASGKYPQNCERDLFRALQLPIATWKRFFKMHTYVNSRMIESCNANFSNLSSEEPFFATIPIRDPADRKKETTLRIPILLPHLLVEYVVNRNVVQISTADMKSFWDHMVAHEVPWATDHPGRHTHYPMGIYGDEGQINKGGDKVVICTANFLLDSRADGFLHRFPIFTLREWCCLGMQSIQPLTQIMAWSFNVLKLQVSREFQSFMSYASESSFDEC